MGSTVFAVTFDCVNAAELAGFWARVTDREVDADGSAAFASVGLATERPGLPRMMFFAVPEGKSAKNRVHLDLVAADLAAEVARLVSFGATKGAEFEEGGARWITLADPEGNEFDLVAA
ncbi:MAG TPA: VOC family protein [Kutzneria sp.]|jgi:hypothetical protein|nr:VOC family protein [Kutzneria sp.]